MFILSKLVKKTNRFLAFVCFQLLFVDVNFTQWRSEVWNILNKVRIQIMFLIMLLFMFLIKIIRTYMQQHNTTAYFHLLLVKANADLKHKTWSIDCFTVQPKQASFLKRLSTLNLKIHEDTILKPSIYISTSIWLDDPTVFGTAIWHKMTFPNITLLREEINITDL